MAANRSFPGWGSGTVGSRVGAAVAVGVGVKVGVEIGTTVGLGAGKLVGSGVGVARRSSLKYRYATPSTSICIQYLMGRTKLSSKTFSVIAVASHSNLVLVRRTSRKSASIVVILITPGRVLKVLWVLSWLNSIASSRKSSQLYESISEVAGVAEGAAGVVPESESEPQAVNIARSANANTHVQSKRREWMVSTSLTERGLPLIEAWQRQVKPQSKISSVAPPEARICRRSAK